MNSIDELKNQKREINRKLKEVREQEIEKAKKNFIKWYNDRILYISKLRVNYRQVFNLQIQNIFND